METTPDYAGHRQRMKLRYLKHGLDSFLDYEVLEFVLTYAIARKDVKPIAKALMGHFKTLHNVFNAPLDELVKIPGIGNHAAILLKLLRDCVERYLHGNIVKADCISSPQALVRYCTVAMAYCAREQFRVIYLNTKNMVVADDVVHEGTIDHIAIYPRTIVEHALRHKAKALIFVHNHPSGDPIPSPQDRDLTQRLVAAVEPLSITVHDHIIIGKSGYYSFREHGEL